MVAKNVIISQSGGPTPVINNSLRGVVEACREYPEIFGTIYAGFHGVEGILKEELIDLSAQPKEEISLLRTTPTAGSIGTCRYKLKSTLPEDFDRVIEVLKAHKIGYLFYIGGNDSMDTANKLSRLAKEKGLELIAVGVPKTIDNDVGDSEFKLIDHTPGYGSVAKYWTTMVQNANEENAGSSPADPVLVLQAMGRKIGYIPAATRLADPEREMPLLIYTAESKATMEKIAEDVNSMLIKRGRAIIIVSEGLTIADLGETKDNFGHTQFSASQTTVSQSIVNYLNSKKLPVKGSARGQVSGVDQRGNMITASVTDLDEAYKLGQKAVEIAVSGDNGYMSTILREKGSIYTVKYDKVPLELVANSERSFPLEWLNQDKNDVTDEFLRYARPLIGDDWVSVPLVNGIMRYARIKPVFADKKLPSYIPQGYK